MGDKLMLTLKIIIIALVLYLIFLQLTQRKEYLDNAFWKMRFQCAEQLSVFELEEDTYGCKLINCERLNTKSNTDVDACQCERNNKTVYRYCATYMVLYEYIGVKNESNIL